MTAAKVPVTGATGHHTVPLWSTQNLLRQSKTQRRNDPMKLFSFQPSPIAEQLAGLPAPLQGFIKHTGEKAA